MTQLPQGTDETHFYHLGEIEVLVLRCQSKHTHERALSTSSSGEHSEVLIDHEGANISASPDKAAESAPEPVAEAEAEDNMGGMFGLFDGPADEPPRAHFTGDGPADGYSRHWQSQQRPPARYGPQEGPYHPPGFYPVSEEAHQPRYSYQESPPPPPPPRPGRHVHFDYGDGRGPHHPYDASYDRLHPGWERNGRPEYVRTQPSSYHDSHHHEHHNPYADYAVPHDREHYMYDQSRRAYAGHREPQQNYDSYRPRSPSPRHRGLHAYPPPSLVYPYPASHPVQHINGPPPFAGTQANTANHAVPVPAGPPPPPHIVPTQPPHPQYPAQVPTHPVPYFMPVGLQPQLAVPPFPGAFPVYPAPGNQPLFHTQGPNTNNGQGRPGTSGPKGTSGQGGGGDSGNNSGNNNNGNDAWTNSGDNNSGNNNGSGNNNNDGWGNPGNNNNATGNSNDNSWETSGGNNNASGGNNDSSWETSVNNNNAAGNNKYPDTDWPPDNNNNADTSNNNNQQDQDWEKNNGASNNDVAGGWNNDASNNNTNDSSGNAGAGWDSNNNDDSGGNTGGWDDNNNSGGNAEAGWDSNNNTTGDNGNNQGWNETNNGNQQSGNDGGWPNDNQNNQNHTGANNQSQSWDNNQNINSAPQDQNAWNNENNNRSASGSQPTPGGGQPNARVLYGPYGPYYGAKSLAQKGPPPDAEEEPRYDVPQAIARHRGVTKQVQPGPGYLYVKKRCAPTYMDTLDEPYAKFVFKYRTKEQLKREIGVDISGEPTGDEEVNALENLDRAELIQMVLRAKGALGGAIPEPAPRQTPVFSNDFQQMPVPAPDMSYLHYNLPPMRNVSNNAGLGIRYSSSTQGTGGASNQNNNQQNNWDNGGGGGDQGWANDTQPQNNNNNAGWDGAQERRPSRPSQGSMRHNNQAPSRRSSNFSPKNTQPAPPRPQAASNDAWAAFDPVPAGGTAGPPPPAPIIVGATGTVGGGQTTWQDEPLGAGPRPETSSGADGASTQPKHGW